MQTDMTESTNAPTSMNSAIRHKISFLNKKANAANTAENTKQTIAVGTAASFANATYVDATTAMSASTDSIAVITARHSEITGTIFFI